MAKATASETVTPGDQHDDLNTPTEAEDFASPRFAKRVIRKIDGRILVLCFITYNFNFMDKTVLSSAAVYGLEDDAVCSLSS